MSTLKFPVGIETFSVVREEGFVYVDKTGFIHELISGGKYYFLSRPRRFGKSLFISTLQSFFEGRRDLFDDLAISSYPYDWEQYPVMRLNLVNVNTSSLDGLRSTLDAHLAEWEARYDVEENQFDYPQRFYRCIKRAFEKTGKKVVVLIDEYDKPLVASLQNESLNRQFRDFLKPIYGTLKAADAYIRFAFISGVSRFSRMSIFSDINNLTDISLSEKYAAICGITEEEMKTQCDAGINNLALSIGRDYDSTLQVLKRQYDGYHFTPGCPDIYNPFSLFSAFELKTLDNFWFATGTPTFLVRALRDSDVYLPDLLHDEADITELSDIDSYRTSSIGLLFQTGYLTIKGYNPDYETYILGLPNVEVSTGFFKDLLPEYMDMPKGKSLKEIRAFIKDVRDGDPESFLVRLRSFLADIPYELSKCKPEIYFENNLYIIFKLMGFLVHSEYRTASGRIDLVVETDRFRYVMELKLNDTAENAMNQIESKDYLVPFLCDGRKTFKMGVSFSSKTRNIDRWIIKES